MKTARERACLAITLWRQEYDDGAVVGLGFLEDKIIAAIEEAIQGEREAVAAEAEQWAIDNGNPGNYGPPHCSHSSEDVAVLVNDVLCDFADHVRRALRQPTEPRGET